MELICSNVTHSEPGDERDDGVGALDAAVNGGNRFEDRIGVELARLRDA